MRRLVATLAALALASCTATPATSPSPPAGPAGEVARQIKTILAANGDLVDQPFEEFAASLDLGKAYGNRAPEILDQIRRSRAAAAAARQASSAGGGSRLASLGGSPTTFTVPYFAAFFASTLEQLTSKGGTVQFPPRPFSSQETGPTTFTTTTLNVTESYSGSGSVATGSVKWTYSTITIETATGATLVHVNDERTLEGKIDVCPDAGGIVPASLVATAAMSATTDATTTSRTSNGRTDFRGTVSDQASLQSVAQETHTDTTSHSAAGDGGLSATTRGTWTAGTSGFFGGFDAGSFGADIAARGITSAAEAVRAAGWDHVLDGFALNAAFDKAQELWRHGRCVVVGAYGVETPIETFKQDAPQHDEAVDGSSQTPFSVQLKHRFQGGALSAPTTVKLTSGEKKAEPGTLSGSGGQVTYTAPAEDQKKATLELKSTSKRGIGTLVLDFHTGNSLTLSINGTLSINSSFLDSTTRVSDTLQVGPIEFKKAAFGGAPGGDWEGTGTWYGVTSSVVTNSLSTQTCNGTETGTITMLARQETREGKKVWVIDPLDASVEGKGTEDCTNTLGGTTLRGVTLPGRYSNETDGSSGELFIGGLKTIVIPAEGGTVRVTGSGVGGDRGTVTVDGTAIGRR
jgi:hypothetical protein